MEQVAVENTASVDLSAGLRGIDASWRMKIAYYLVSRRSEAKRIIAVFSDLLVLAVSMLFSIALTHHTLDFSPSDVILISIGPLFATAFLWWFGAYRVVVRFIGMEIIERCLLSMMTASFVFYFLRRIFSDNVSWHALVSFTFVGFVALLVTRRMASWFLRPFLKRNDVTNVIIYGAGGAGAQLVAALFINSRYRPIGFIDDRADLKGRTIRGLRVYSQDEAADLKKQNRFDHILLAIPSASRASHRRILEQLEPLAVKVMVMPGMEDLVSGRKRIDEFREVQIEDILERDPVAPTDSLLDACIRGKSVLVTGAGGSIGSELCRQIIRRGVSQLVLFDVSEFVLYAIEHELRQAGLAQSLQIIPVLGSVLDRNAVARAIGQFKVETIYHAAAYKHVPLVESNVISAVQNNIIGTLNVVEEAINHDVKNFVLISTDKAVRPTNVMGATKRVCELIVQAKAQQHPKIRMTMVRFGNVLASSGSVVPLFKQQIRSGGPITVTHPDVTRYFMTIPEAALLVIQAGSMGARGEVFVLDMGQPIKILDLARRMIHLSGLEIREAGAEQGDIEIQFTGLRPGEKLYEELLISGNPEGTKHPRIFKAQENFLAWEALSERVSAMVQACESQSEERAKAILAELVFGYGLKVSELPSFHREEPDLIFAAGYGQVTKH